MPGSSDGTSCTNVRAEFTNCFFLAFSALRLGACGFVAPSSREPSRFASRPFRFRCLAAETAELVARGTRERARLLRSLSLPLSGVPLLTGLVGALGPAPLRVAMLTLSGCHPEGSCAIDPRLVPACGPTRQRPGISLGQARPSEHAGAIALSMRVKPSQLNMETEKSWGCRAR